MIVRVDARVAFRASQDPKTGYWVAISDALRITLSGQTWTELNRAIGEGLDLLFRDLLDDGELKAFLVEHGWRLSGPTPAKATRRKITFDVPFVVDKI